MKEDLLAKNLCNGDDSHHIEFVDMKEYKNEDEMLIKEEALDDDEQSINAFKLQSNPLDLDDSKKIMYEEDEWMRKQETEVNDENGFKTEIDSFSINPLEIGIIKHEVITNKKSFECDHCNKTFKRRSDLNRHLLIHTSEGSFECELCKKKFLRKDILKIHLISHTSDKPYECEHCHKKYKTNGYLKYHLLSHTEEKSFECEYCNKKFTKKKNLKIHLLNHTTEKKFKCEYCTNTWFTLKCNLKAHLLTHTGEKLFKCEQCNKSFTTKGNLNAHLMRHTGQTVFIKCEQ